MATKQFDSFTVRPALNGIIVEPIYSPGELRDISNCMVFNSFDDFVDYLRSEIQESK